MTQLPTHDPIDLIERHFAAGNGVGAAARGEVIRQALELLQGWLKGDRAHAYPVTPLADLAALFEQPAPPAHGMDEGALLAHIESTVLAHSAQLHHPQYIGHMTQALPWFSVIAEAITAALNQNQVKIETAYASTLVEKQVLGWMHRLVYGRDDAFYHAALHASSQPLGNMVGGGTMGNLSALAVALERALPGTRERGLYATLSESPWRGVAVIGSTRIHYSLKKAVATLGMGQQSLHLVPVGRDNRIDLALLQAKLDELRAQRIRVVAVVGIAGATETGAIDPLAELAAAARAEDAWFHVDAAWGGALLIDPAMRPLYAGIEQADSVVIDGHKLMFVPMAQGMLLLRERGSLDSLVHHANYIIRANSGDLGQTSLEGSRRFDAFKLWISFKLLGVDGYIGLLRHAARLSAAMKALLREQPDFELLTDSHTFILTYRYIPATVRAALARLLEEGRDAEAAALNGRINQLNSALQEAQKARGVSFVSRTFLESTGHPGGTTVLRAVLTNVTTTPQHLHAIVEEQRQLGAGLCAQFELG